MYRLKLALRYLFRRRISYLAIAAVALCVFIVVIVMTVHSGLVRQFKDKNHNFYSDCIISTDSMVGFSYYEDFIAELQKQPYVYAASPAVITIGSLTRAGYDENIGIEIMGIDISRHKNVSNFADTLHYNRQNPDKAFNIKGSPDDAGLIIGIAMMSSRDKQGIYFHPSEPINMQVEISCVPLTARGAMQKADTDYVNSKIFYFADDSQSNLAMVDSRMVYIPFEQAQTLAGMADSIPRTSAVFIKFKPGQDVESATAQVRSLWNNFVLLNKTKPNADLFETVNVQTWKQYCRHTIAWMEKEQIMLTALFLMVAITTVFIVFVIFYMIISHKSKDIGILRSVGVSSFSILWIFLYFAALIGLIGSAVGSLLGWLFLLKINEMENLLLKWKGIQVFDRSIFAIGELPNQIQPMMLLIIIATAVLACLLGALIPSLQAARGKPAETLKVSQL
jgi:lipoprotein-releasing system permease protein